MITEYGDRNAPCVVLIHPMLTSAEMMYNVIGSRLKGRYRIIAPDQGSHGRSQREFVSAEDEAARLHDYLLSEGITKIALVYGASLGAVCAMKLTHYEDIEIEELYLDGIPFTKRPAYVAPLMTAMVYAWKTFGKNADKVLSRAYGSAGTAMAECLNKMKLRTFARIFRDCTAGCEREFDCRRQKHLFFDYGEKELSCYYGYKTEKKLYPEAKFFIHRGYSHCNYLVKNPDRYVSRLEKIIQRGIKS
ncbi:MAG: alpha/beta hydrolase [Oscillospiraceae bacterium]|nr:alpha/beta hydrolase [Oscillospiraceae bacterium]